MEKWLLQADRRLIVVIRDSEKVKHRLEPILCRQTGVYKKAFLVILLRESPVVESFHVIGDDEWDHTVGKAFLEHDEPAHTTVLILKGVDALEVMSAKECFTRGSYVVRNPLTSPLTLSGGVVLRPVTSLGKRL